MNKIEVEKCDCCWYYIFDVGMIVGYIIICGCCVFNVEGEGEVCKFV